MSIGELVLRPARGRPWLLAAALLFVLAMTPGGQAAATVVQCDTSWASPTSGYWDIAANWTNGAPTSATNVCIAVPGFYTVTVRGESNVAAGLTLYAPIRLEISGSAAAGNATLTLLDQGAASGGLIGNLESGPAKLALTTTDASAWAKVDVAGGTLVNTGTIFVEPGAGNAGGRYWHGQLSGGPPNWGWMEINEDLAVSADGSWPWKDIRLRIASGKTLSIPSGLQMRSLYGPASGDAEPATVEGDVLGGDLDGTLKIVGSLQKAERVIVYITGSKVGRLEVSGAATLKGGLGIGGDFEQDVGQTFVVLTAGSLSGEFGRWPWSGSTRYYRPSYSATDVTVQVKEVAVSLLPSQGPPGTHVTFSGDDWPAGDGIAFRMFDAARHKFKLGRTTVDSSGHFSTTITMPPGAAPGPATIKISSKVRVQGLQVRKTFTVT